MTHKFLVKICFDGSCYYGWQIQKKNKTLQDEIQKVLSKILNTNIIIYSCSRTDAGVHAQEFFFHFKVNKLNNNLLHALNALLPPSIRALEITKVNINFHARFDAKSKIYEYNICTKKVQCPFRRITSLHHPNPLDLKLMKKGARLVEGKHDFRGFSNKNDQGSAHNQPIKTLKPIHFIESDDTLALRFEADGFLYKMVRNLTQTLLFLGTNKITLDHVKKILETKDRKICPPPAPAHGLTLISVKY